MLVEGTQVQHLHTLHNVVKLLSDQVELLIIRILVEEHSLFGVSVEFTKVASGVGAELPLHLGVEIGTCLPQGRDVTSPRRVQGLTHTPRMLILQASFYH